MENYRYTEADFASKAAAQKSLMRLLQPLKPFYSPGGAQLAIGATSAHYEDEAARMEAFARPLWGLAGAASRALRRFTAPALPTAPTPPTPNTGGNATTLTRSFARWRPFPTPFCWPRKPCGSPFRSRKRQT